MLRRVLRRAQEASRSVQRGIAPPAALCAKLVQQAARLGAAVLAAQEAWGGLVAHCQDLLTAHLAVTRRARLAAWARQTSGLKGAVSWLKRTVPPPWAVATPSSDGGPLEIAA
eukprot:588425-Alexandrium_andersonii.AAC.1